MKKAVKLLRVVIAMMIAALMLATPVFGGAYSAPGPVQGVPPINTPTFPAQQNEFELFRVYHYVVRGDTLQSIANKWGTTPESIIDFNTQYFTDLWLRNVTYSSSVVAAPVIRLEPGVRLHIYDVLRVRHYVRRADTLEGIARGDANMLNPTPSGFRIQTTVDAIRRENTEWFRDLAALNVTWATNVPLVESGAIGSVYQLRYFDWPFVLSSVLDTANSFGNDGLLGTRLPHNARLAPQFLVGINPDNDRWFPNNWNNTQSLPDGAFFSGNVFGVNYGPIGFSQWPIVTDEAGTPLFISVPARAWTFNLPTGATGTTPMPVYEFSYYRSIVEQVPWPGAVFGYNPQVTTFNPPTTNPVLDDEFVVGVSPVAGFNLNFLGYQYVSFSGAPGIPVEGNRMTAPASWPGLFGNGGALNPANFGARTIEPTPVANQPWGALVSPAPLPNDVAATALPPADSTVTTVANTVEYTVVAGDTLASIASRHGTTWQHLAEINNDRLISGPHVIHVGWQLRVPARAS